MKVLHITATVAVCAAWLPGAPARSEDKAATPARITFEQTDDALLVQVDGRTVATYLLSHERLTRPALINVHSPRGTQVTRSFPPRLPEDRSPGYKGEGGIDHPTMHAGLWISFGNLDGQDYWRLKAQVKHDRFVEAPRSSGSRASFAVRNRYLSEDGREEVCRDVTRYEWQLGPWGMLLLIEAVFRSDRDFYFGDQEESGLALRVASPLRVLGGKGTILNDRGERNEAEIWGKEARWVDYFGPVDDGRIAGVMLMPSPTNPRPCWIHARDYGVVVCNPFPRQPNERREPYVKTWVKQGKPHRLAWGVAIHDTEPSEFNRERVYADYVAQVGGEKK